MKVLKSWLEDYVKTGLSAEQIAQTLSDLGLPCEAIEQLSSGDTVIDIEVTSNRGDCLGYIGLARELAAALDKQLCIPAVELTESSREVEKFATLDIAEPDLCPRYTARVIYGLTVGPSPDWLRKRLEAVGLRSVNNVVDATNYAMLETSQPPHAFDYDKIKGAKIIVRKAAAGESIVSIDGSKCELTTETLVIADEHEPIAIAGVMGALDSEVTESTKTVLLEDAFFNPAAVRNASRRLAIDSDAAFRFERTVDIEAINSASERTAQLIIQLAGGSLARGVLDEYHKKPPQKKVELRLSRLKKLLGIKIPPEKLMRYLAGLEFQPERSGKVIRCTVPSWRSDIYREADLIEEVARLHGYDKIPAGRKINIEVVPVGARDKFTRRVTDFLNGCGYYETINTSFLDISTAEIFSDDHERQLAVKTVSKKNENLLRRTLIPSLLNVVKTNVQLKNIPCRVFELADTFAAGDAEVQTPVERTRLSIAADGDLREIKGVTEALIKNINPKAKINFVPEKLIWAQAGAQIIVNGKSIGTAGVISETVRKNFAFKEQTPCVVELDFDRLISLQPDAIQVKPLPRYPAVERDISVVVDDDVCWADVEKAVIEKAPKQLENISFMDIYKGAEIEDKKKSITLSLRFRDTEGTLTHQAVDNFQQQVVNNLARSIDAKLRTF